jgi:hypothetical protein
MFRVVSPPIIGSANNCIYSIWYLSHRYCYLPLSWKRWNSFECVVGGVTVWQIPDAVDTVVCAPDDGWRYHPKHLEQFPDKTNSVTSHLVGYILEYPQNARNHERLKKNCSTDFQRISVGSPKPLYKAIQASKHPLKYFVTGSLL